MLQAVERGPEELGGFECGGWGPRPELEMAEKNNKCAYYCVSRLSMRLRPPLAGFRCRRLSLVIGQRKVGARVGFGSFRIKQVRKQPLSAKNTQTCNVSIFKIRKS